jgi:7-carboxy-7-deazaguanine synthase
MHAVDPVAVRRTAIAMNVAQIVERITELGGSARMVVLTGGNPALHELGHLVRQLHTAGRSVSVETQGTVFRPWLREVDRLVISPKPPSAGVDHVKGRRAFERFLGAAGLSPNVAIKVVVFDEADLRFAEGIAADHPGAALYLSAGTPVGLSDGVTRAQIIARTRWLVEVVGSTTVLGHARVLPQLHIMLWGTKLGV